MIKVFVANPRKPVDITLILVKNRDKLVTYLRNFHNDKDADAQFAEEKALVVETLLAWTLSNAKMDRKLNALLLGVKLPPRPSAWHLRQVSLKSLACRGCQRCKSFSWQPTASQ